MFAILEKIFLFFVLIIRQKEKYLNLVCFMESISVSSQSRIEKITTPNFQLSS